MAGSRGPIGKRSEMRIRRNKPIIDLVEGESGKRTEAPFSIEGQNWHPIAILFWESLEQSGQSQFYEESDWAAAFFTCEAMSRELKPQFIGFRESPAEWGTNDEGERIMLRSGGTTPTMGVVPIKGASLTAIRASMAALLVTEGDRRRMAIELSKTPAGPDLAGQAVLDAVMSMKDDLAARRDAKQAGA